MSVARKCIATIDPRSGGRSGPKDGAICHVTSAEKSCHKGGGLSVAFVIWLGPDQADPATVTRSRDEDTA